MAEVVGTIFAAPALIEQSFTLLGRVQTAIERHRGYSNYLSELSSGIATTKDIVGLVRDECVLSTNGVAKAIRHVVTVVTALESFLADLENAARANIGPMRQVAHQLFKGPKEQQKLDEMKAALLGAKADLSLYVQVAHVGLTRNASQALVDAFLVERIDRLLQMRLGKGKGLQIAALIKQRPRNGDGMVPLTDEDLKTLPTPPEPTTTELDTLSGTRRDVETNSTFDAAVQVNAAIGKDGWKESAKHLTIRNNIARGYSTQINHAISRDDFRDLAKGRFAGLANMKMSQC